MINENKGATEAAAETLRTWTAPTAEIHSIEVVEATGRNFSNPNDGGTAPCRS